MHRPEHYVYIGQMAPSARSARDRRPMGERAQEARVTASDEPLIERMAGGDRAAFAALYDRHAPRVLGLLISLVRDRSAAEDVLQDAFMAATKRLDRYATDAPPSAFIWLRMFVLHRLADLHRRHLGAQKRSAAREVPIFGAHDAQATSASLVIQLAGDRTSPSQAVVRAETREALRQTIEGMDPLDREVLAMRHFEELTNSEIAAVLDISQKAASIRYFRAMRRLQGILSDLTEFGSEVRDG